MFDQPTRSFYDFVVLTLSVGVRRDAWTPREGVASGDLNHPSGSSFPSASPAASIAAKL